MTGVRFLQTRQTVDISKAGRERLQSQRASGDKAQQSARRIKTSQEQAAGDVNPYIRYQREIEAEKLVGAGKKAKPPGRILKLPSWRKEIMSRSDE